MIALTANGNFLRVSTQNSQRVSFWVHSSNCIVSNGTKTLRSLDLLWVSNVIENMWKLHENFPHKISQQWSQNLLKKSINQNFLLEKICINVQCWFHNLILKVCCFGKDLIPHVGKYTFFFMRDYVKNMHFNTHKWHQFISKILNNNKVINRLLPFE